MLTSYAGCWGSFTLRGLSLLLFGAVVLLAPAALDLVVVMLSVALLVGASNAASVGLRLRPLTGQWWVFLVEAGLAAVIGAVAFLRPAPAVLTLVPLLAALAMLNGIVQLWLAWRWRRGQNQTGLIAGAGLLSVGFSVLLAWQPLLSKGAAATGAGLFAILLGVAFALTGLRLRRLGRLARRELLRDTPLAQRPARRAEPARGLHPV